MKTFSALLLGNGLNQLKLLLSRKVKTSLWKWHFFLVIEFQWKNSLTGDQISIIFSSTHRLIFSSSPLCHSFHFIGTWLRKKRFAFYDTNLLAVETTSDCSVMEKKHDSAFLFSHRSSMWQNRSPTKNPTDHHSTTTIKHEPTDKSSRTTSEHDDSHRDHDLSPQRSTDESRSDNHERKHHHHHHHKAHKRHKTKHDLSVNGDRYVNKIELLAWTVLWRSSSSSPPVVTNIRPSPQCLIWPSNTSRAKPCQCQRRFLFLLISTRNSLLYRHFPRFPRLTIQDPFPVVTILHWCWPIVTIMVNIHAICPCHLHRLRPLDLFHIHSLWETRIPIHPHQWRRCSRNFIQASYRVIWPRRLQQRLPHRRIVIHPYLH